MLFLLVLCAWFPTLALATNLWVSSYSGTVTTLSLTHKKKVHSLRQVAVSNQCLGDPSWLTYDSKYDTLYCIGEGLAGFGGNLTAFKANPDGSLTVESQQPTVSGGVNGILYSNPPGGTYLAIAHYGGSAITAWSLADPAKPSLIEALNFPLTIGLGPNTLRQDAPHPHEVILDPTGKFILSPDLGTDTVRIFGIANNGSLVNCPNVTVYSGSGPRHGAFHTPKHSRSPKNSTTFYLVSELADELTAYHVIYPPTGECLSLQEVAFSTTLGPFSVPAGTAVAEIVVLGSSILLSNRNDSSFILPSTPSSPQTTHSDSLAVFHHTQCGNFRFQQLAPAGGSFPRQFSVNKAGTLVAVGLQHSGSVVIIERDAMSGELRRIVAEVDGLGLVTCVIWDE